MEELLNKASKLEAILSAWSDFVTLLDLNNAKVSGNEIKFNDVKLSENCVLIGRELFADLKRQVSEESNQEESVWVISFPRLYTDDGKGSSEYYPLFSLDITSILKGEYQENGWSLNSLELTEAGENLTTFLKLDEEQSEQLVTQEGLRRFLETTFGLNFETYEAWMNQVSIPGSYNIERKPYLFQYKVSNFQKNLKLDFKDIKLNHKNCLTSKSPADEYLFGEPQLPEHERIYMGAFPTHPPTESQLKAIKHAQTEPLTAVQGPPGSGKTTLILHIIAQQVVKRTLKLIETGKDENNLIVVSSTVNKAVDNVIEKLDEYFQEKSADNKSFYLKGGSKTNIKSPGAARDELKNAITNFLDKNSFDENLFNFLAEEIKRIKSGLTVRESKYLNLSRQRKADEAQKPQLREKIEQLESELESNNAAKRQSESRAAQLEPYTQLPVDNN